MQQLGERLQRVAARRQGVAQPPPGARPQRGAALEEGGDVGAAGDETRAQQQPAHRGGIGRGVGDGQRRAPGPADDEPARKAQLLAQPAQIGDEVVGAVVLDAAARLAEPGAALVHADHAVARRVEKARLQRRAARTRAAMQRDGGDAVGAAVLADAQAMAAFDRHGPVAQQRGRGIQRDRGTHAGDGSGVAAGPAATNHENHEVRFMVAGLCSARPRREHAARDPEIPAPAVRWACNPSPQETSHAMADPHRPGLPLRLRDHPLRQRALIR